MHVNTSLLKMADQLILPLAVSCLILLMTTVLCLSRYYVLVSTQAGGVAGTTVDVVLFPLDTLKTRLQSKEGFRRSGGFRGIYSGILPAAAGSAPSGEVFEWHRLIY